MTGQMLLFPFMAKGHFNAFVNFAMLVHRHHPSCTITMISTPLNANMLRSMLPPSPQFRFSVLPFDPTAHGLPQDAECTDVLPPQLINQLVDVSIHCFRPALEQLLSAAMMTSTSGDGETGQRGDTCLVSDVFCSWAVDVAEKLGIPQVVLSTCGAFGTASTFSMWLHLPHLNSSSDEFELPGWTTTTRLHRSQLNDNLKAATGEDAKSIAYKSFTNWSLRSKGMLVNSVEEMEKKGLQQLRVMYGDKPVWSIGPLVSRSILDDDTTHEKPSTQRRLGREPGLSDEDCTKWLDQHVPGSVLYISLGSQLTVSSSQMRELASGLEKSEKNFIWVVRPPSEFKLEDEFRASEWLPAGFEERTRERNQGLVVRNWAPQLIILRHESTGAFLSHCGWNSVLESLSHGMPMIGWPQAAEQFYNAKTMVEEMGVCVELARGNKAEIRGEDVAKVVNQVVGTNATKGEEMRCNAKKWREKMVRAVRGRKTDGCGDDSVGSSIASLNSFMERELNVAQR